TRWLSLFHPLASIAAQPQQLSRTEGSLRLCPSRLLPYGVALAVIVILLLVFHALNQRLVDDVLPLMLGVTVMISALRIEYVYRARRYAEAEAAAHQRTQDDIRTLHQTLQQQALLLEAFCEPICIWDLEHGIVEWNRGCEQLYGIPKAKALGQVIHVLLQTQFPMALAEYQRLLSRDGQWSGELWHTTRTGREVLVASCQRLLQIDGRCLVLASERDITACRQAERALLQAYAELAQHVPEGATAWRRAS